MSATALHRSLSWDTTADLIGAGMRSLFVSLAVFAGGSVAILLLVMTLVFGVTSPRILAVGASFLAIQTLNIALILAPVSLVVLPLLGALLRDRGRLAGFAFRISAIFAAVALVHQPHGMEAFGEMRPFVPPVMVVLGLICGMTFIGALRRYETATP